ncbi:MAG TPA: hypothetical protein VKV95_11370 [Terriglobia bacterium]|nr:hypothetical protein [Terriglobia bacterium]
MGAEQIRISQLGLNGDSGDANVVDRTNDRQQADAYVHCQIFPRLAITVGLLAYAYFLAWESWRELSHFMVNPGSTGVAIVIVAIQMVSPLLPGLAYAVTHLSWRRSPPWFLSAGALCLTGLVTAAIKMFVYANG